MHRRDLLRFLSLAAVAGAAGRGNFRVTSPRPHAERRGESWNRANTD